MEQSQVFGLRLGELLASCAPGSFALKMSQQSLFEEDQQLLKTLPSSGILQNGKLYQLEKEERRILETAGFALPTPTAHLAKENPSTPSAWNRKSSLSVEAAKLAEITLKDIGKKKLTLNPLFVEWLMGYPPGWTEPD